MHRSDLKEIIQEQYSELNQLTEGIAREKLSEVSSLLKLPHIIAITGMRRSGKSTLMRQLLKKIKLDNIYYLDFEDERLLQFNVSDFNLLFEIYMELFGERKTFFFDEIQIIPEWESYVRRMYKSGYKFIITGSSADLLSSELSTKLTGRHVAIELLPFSFREYLTFNNIHMDGRQTLLTKDRALLKKTFNNYLQHGGIPEYLQYQNPIILKSIYENIIFKDVIVRYDIKAVKSLREIALWLLSNPGALISYAKLKNQLQLGSVNTVKNYIHYLENAYLIFTLDKYFPSVGTQTISQKKVYAIDTGLLEQVGFQFSKNIGKYLENVVYLELRRRNHEEIYYYKTQNDLEVDFCLRKGKEISHLIQVTHDLSDNSTRDREIRALTTAMDEQNLTHGLIINSDSQETISIDDKIIEIIPIIKWLLDYHTD